MPFDTVWGLGVIVFLLAGWWLLMAGAIAVALVLIAVTAHSCGSWQDSSATAYLDRY